MNRRGPLTGPFAGRLLAAILLRRRLYDEVAADRGAVSQAAAVVCLSALAQRSPPAELLGAWGLLLAMLLAIVRWPVFTALVYPVARLIARRPADYWSLLRCLGFAEAPAILNLVGLAVGDPPLLRIAVWLWLLAAAVVAVRAAVGVGTGRAVCIGVISFVMYLLIGAWLA